MTDWMVFFICVFGFLSITVICICICRIVDKVIESINSEDEVEEDETEVEG